MTVLCFNIMEDRCVPDTKPKPAVDLAAKSICLFTLSTCSDLFGEKAYSALAQLLAIVIQGYTGRLVKWVVICNDNCKLYEGTFSNKEANL